MSLFNDFFGKTQQQDLSNANALATQNINAYGDKSRGAYQAGADKASGYYDRYAQSGGRAQTAYDDSIGINGAQGGQNALTMYGNARNPYLQYEQDRAQRGLDNAANARGQLNTGYNAIASSRARQQLGYQDYQGWQNRLQGAGQQGFQAAGAQAGLAEGAGRYAGDSYSGQGQQLAGNAINYGNAMAQSRSTGINNLMGLGSLAVRAAAAGATGGMSEVAGAAAGGFPRGNAVGSMRNPV